MLVPVLQLRKLRQPRASHPESMETLAQHPSGLSPEPYSERSHTHILGGHPLMGITGLRLSYNGSSISEETRDEPGEGYWKGCWAVGTSELRLGGRRALCVSWNIKFEAEGMEDQLTVVACRMMTALPPRPPCLNHQDLQVCHLTAKKDLADGIK